MPTWSATARAARSLSPVSRTGFKPSARRRAMASALVGLTVSATTSRARSSPSHPARIAVRPSASAASLAARRSGGRRHRPVGEQRLAAGDDGVTVDDALDAETFEVGEVLDGRSGPRSVAGGAGDRFGDRVLGGVFERTDQSEHLVAVGPSTVTTSMSSSGRWSPCRSCRARRCRSVGSTRGPRVL